MSKELRQSQHDPHQICIYREADNHRNSITCARDGRMVHSSEYVSFITLAAKRGPLWDLWRDIDEQQITRQMHSYEGMQ